MTDDASVLQAAWMSSPPTSGDQRRTTVDLILERDRASRLRERRQQIGAVIVMMLLVPVLVWAAVYGISPLVRTAYALMTVGCVAGVAAQWFFLDWSRRALPGPSDTRSQLRNSAFMLACQGWLARTAALWSAPVFVGVLLIGLWLYRERSAAEAVALFALDVGVWIATGIFVGRAGSVLARRRRQLEDALSDLDARDSA